MSEIRVTKNGPYLVSGELPIAKATIGANAEGESITRYAAPDERDESRFVAVEIGRASCRERVFRTV